MSHGRPSPGRPEPVGPRKSGGSFQTNRGRGRNEPLPGMTTQTTKNTHVFANGDRMALLGLGTWKSEPGEVGRAVREAIRIGYRHIDCAAFYGNEVEVGQAVRDAIAAGDVSRQELWITSKLWCNAHGRKNVGPALDKGLQD